MGRAGRMPMLRMKSQKHTNKRHSLSQISSQYTYGACASSDPGVRMLLPVFTSNNRGMVAAMFLSCICFCGVFRSDFVRWVLFQKNNSFEFVFLNFYSTIVALSSNVIHKIEITKDSYLFSSVWMFFFFLVSTYLSIGA